MPAFVPVPIPPYGRVGHDLKDNDSPVDRSLEQVSAGLSMVQQYLRNLRYSAQSTYGVLPPSATAEATQTGKYPRPLHITSAQGIIDYEAAVEAAITAVTTALSKVQSVNSLT